MKPLLLGLYRIRSVIFGASVAAILVVTVLRLTTLVPLVFVGFGGMLVAGLLIVLGPRLLPSHPPVTVTPPVRGRWLGMNSPATKVPSHGVRAYGQAYAIDLVFEPADGPARPEFASGPAFRGNDEYPAFGEPVLAMIDGVVVTASDWKRDHRARSHYPALLYLTVEGAIRELGGPGFIIGNHVVIRGDDGVFALVAHLQKGSAAVKRGDRVTAGQVLGRCGNSGNSTEPHVHAQLMDRASPLTGQGIPFAFAGHSVPADGEHLEV